MSLSQAVMNITIRLFYKAAVYQSTANSFKSYFRHVSYSILRELNVLNGICKMYFLHESVF